MIQALYPTRALLVLTSCPTVGDDDLISIRTAPILVAWASGSYGCVNPRPTRNRQIKKRPNIRMAAWSRGEVQALLGPALDELEVVT